MCIRAMIQIFDGEQQVAGNTVLNEQTLSFEPASPFALNKCYTYKTDDSVLKGLEQGEQVKVETGSICTPHALINVPANPEVSQ